MQICVSWGWMLHSWSQLHSTSSHSSFQSFGAKRRFSTLGMNQHHPCTPCLGMGPGKHSSSCYKNSDRCVLSSSFFIYCVP